MGTPKRERQRNLKAAKQAVQAAEVKTYRRRHQLRQVLVVVGTVFAAGLLIYLLGSRGDNDQAATTSSTASSNAATTAVTTVAVAQATSTALFRSQTTACGKTLPSEPKLMSFTQAEDQAISPDAIVTATLATSCGEIVLTLDQKAAPKTVNSFVFLARQGYYEGAPFHRVIAGFMAQGGDPTGTGSGGPGYSLPDENLPTATPGYPRGLAAMANSGPNTSGSQFFLMLADTPLPANYSVFGKVTSGLETLDAIAQLPVGPTDRGEQSRPLQSVYIEKVTVSVS